MLLDGNGLIYRGYFALPPLTTSKGELVNAVFGFASIVLRGFQDIAPDFVANERSSMGESWVDQEYNCLFTALEGLVYPGFEERLDVAAEDVLFAVEERGPGG